MAGTIYVRFDEHGAAWLVQEADGGFLREQHGDLAEAGRAGTGLRTVVLAPAAHLLLTETDLPLKNRNKLRQAVPYAIEEQLSADVEELHFALGAQRDESGLAVAVVARERLRGWLDDLATAGLQAGSLVPDVLALPFTPGQWTLLLGRETALLRTGPARGYALDRETLPLLLDIAFEQAGEARPERLRVFDARDDGSAQVAVAAAEARQVPAVVEACPQGELGLLARQLGGTPPVELLQGEFSRREQLGRLWRPWRGAAVLLGILLLVQGGLATWDYLRLSREADELSQRIEAIYRQTFPEARNVVDPRRQMETRLAALKSGSGDAFAGLLAKAAPVVHGGGGAEIAALRYKDGVLDMDLNLSDLQALDRLKQALTGQGLGVDIQTASARGGKVEARLQIREAR
ncbi:MAG: type II secretion system protein GspL [Gammaproteobacteria bacterium]|nr:type II secretion system protein GspL [Gammaproteobacteria bacterium]